MTTLTKSEIVRARIEPQVKRDAKSILKNLGVSQSTFINMSYRAVISEGGSPLSLRVPNAETTKVLKEAREPKLRAKYEKASTVADLRAALSV